MPKVEDNQPKKEDLAYNKAVDLLSRRMHTTKELTFKLKIRKFDPKVIKTVLERLVSLGLLNDANFADVYLENLLRTKTFGYYGIRAKLLSKGIDSRSVDELLSEKLTLEKERQLADKFLQKFGHKETKKLAQSLAARGFRSEIIRDFISNTGE